MGNILPSGEWALEELKFIDLPPNEIEKYTVRDGDIFFNRTNSPDLVGMTGVYRGNKVYAYAGYLVRLRVNSYAVPEYIGTFLNSPFGKKTLRGMCKAIIGMANINAQELRAIPIALPPISLQEQFRDRVLAIQSLLPTYREQDLKRTATAFLGDVRANLDRFSSEANANHGLLDEHLTAIDTALTHIGDSLAEMEVPYKVSADAA
jgi:restriction endonuclease S subunit